jgi:hypothetical protein
MLMGLYHRIAICAATLSLLVGCAASKPDGLTATQNMRVEQAQTVGTARDAAAVLPLLFHVRIFLFPVPDGTFSGNEEFWKRIDEQVFDVATADLLYKNGLRVGEAPLTELETFGKYMEGVLPLQDIQIPALEGGTQLEMRMNQMQQTIFYLNQQNQSIGQSYEGSDNLLNVNFKAAPHKPKTVRLSLAPMVRASRKMLHYTTQNTEQEIAYDNPEYLLDLNFEVDLAPDRFLVVTPSPDAIRTSSVGHAFFKKETQTQQQEQVMIIISEPVELPPPPQAAKSK